jgi:predicted dehydrogenase
VCASSLSVMSIPTCSLKGVANQAKKNNTVTAYTDYRKLMLDPEVDAVTIATPNHTHTLIAMTAMAAGKHVYVEKPVCHNIWEGRQLLNAAEKVAKKGLVVQHGMQRRSSPGWQQAMDWVKEGHIGKVTLSRGLNYKSRISIGKVAAPVEAKDGVVKGTFHDLRNVKTAGRAAGRGCGLQAVGRSTRRRPGEPHAVPL